MLVISLLSILLIPQVAADTGDNIIGFYPLTQHVTIGDIFNSTINVTVVWEIDSAAVDNLTFQPAGKLNYTCTTKGNLFGGTTMWQEPEVDGTIDNVTGYAKPILWTYGAGVNNTNKTLATITWYANNVGVAYINQTEGGTAESGSDNGTVSQNATVYIHPFRPMQTEVATINWSALNLHWNPSWGGDEGTDKVRIVYSEVGFPSDSDPNDGTLAYNGTGTPAFGDIVEWDHTGLNEGQTNYYRFWSWNETYGMYSLIGTTDSGTTSTNISWPVFSNPDPTNGSTNMELIFVWNITIEDSDGDNFNWSITCSNGDYNSGTNDGNGSKTCDLSLGFDTTYTITVNACEFGNSSNCTDEWFTFTTKAGPSCPDTEQGGEWNQSEHVRDETLDEDWVFLTGDWSASGAINATGDWIGNWSLEYNSTTGSSFSAAFMNCSWANRTQSLMWTRTDTNDELFWDIYPGVVYAYYNDTNFSMVLYGSNEVFLLDYENGLLFNTEDGTPVDGVGDAKNYWYPAWGWDDQYEDLYYEFLPWDDDGLWIKTIYNSYCGRVQSKYWGAPLVPMDEPAGWLVDDYFANAETTDSVGYGVAVWNPSNQNCTAYYDFMNLWKLNYTVNESHIIEGGLIPGYRAHMDFPVIDMMDIGDDWLNFVLDETEGNLTMDNVTDFLINFTNSFNMESRGYNPSMSINPLDQNDVIYYYSGLFVNFSVWANETMEIPLEDIPNIMLWLYIMDCPNGEDPALGDYAFVSIDADDDGVWDPNDRAWYWDTSGLWGSWHGNFPDAIGDFDAMAGAFTTDSGSSRNIHRYNNHNQYWIALPLANIEHNDETYLNESDIFGLHIHTGNIDDWGSPVWENWNETACMSLFPEEDWSLVWNLYLGTPWPEPGMPLPIEPENLALWGEGEIGSFAGDFSEFGYGYSVSINKTANVTSITYNNTVGATHLINYTINITNTGDTTVTGILINGTWWNCSCSGWNATLVSTNIDMGDFAFHECYYIIDDPDTNILNSGESNVIWFVVNVTGCEDNITAWLINYDNVSTTEGATSSDSWSIWWGLPTTHLRATYQCGSSTLPTILNILPLLIAVVLVIMFAAAMAAGIVTPEQLIALLIAAVIVIVSIQLAVDLTQNVSSTGTETFAVTDPSADQILNLSSSCDDPTVTLMQQYTGTWITVSSSYYSTVGRQVTVQKEALYT